MTMRIVWDPAKDLSNRRKHRGVSFALATRVFEDPFHQMRQDRFEGGEERWQTIGVVEGVTILIVAHTMQEWAEDGTWIEVVRIISARKADPAERRRYAEGTH